MRIILALVAAWFCIVTDLGPADAGVTVTVTTTPSGGQYAPRNVVVVWVEDAAGAFVKTIDRHAGTRARHLVAWNAKAGANDVDAVSGATRSDHAQPLTLTWDLTDRQNALVPDGTYTIRMELADENASQAAQNNQGTFTFVKGAAPESQSGLASGGFQNVSIDFQPVITTCNNGVVDANETCDPAVAGSCPTSCPASADACMPNVLAGTAAACTAACVAQPITACANDDGCCPDGCEGSDSDCDGTAAAPGDDIAGGCSAGGSSRLALLALALGLLACRRRART